MKLGKILLYGLIIIYCHIIFTSCKTTLKKQNNKPTLESSSSIPDKITLSDILQKIDGGSIVPQKYRRIYIMPIKNNNENKISEVLFQESFQDEIIKKQYDFILVNTKEESELLLYIAIVNYKDIPLTYNEVQAVESYRTYILLNIKLDVNPDIKRETILFNNLVEYEDVHKPQEFPYESKYTFKQRIYENISERILSILYNGWYQTEE